MGCLANLMVVDFWSVAGTAWSSLEGLSGLEKLKHGPVYPEMNGSDCICVPDTHTEALDDSGTLLDFVGGDFGLEMGLRKGRLWRAPFLGL